MRSLLLLPFFLAGGVAFAAVVAAQEAGDAATETQAPAEDELASAIFAGGCFWCMEPPYDKLEGVVSTTSGYIGGETENPSYEQVSAGSTGHAEAVRVVYDPAKVGYAELVNVFWPNIDPLTANAQFCDHGSQYRSAIFYVNEEQERLARKSKEVLETSGRFEEPIVTEIVPAGEFYPAEDYHQNYYEKNPLQYKFYRYMCGRDQRLEDLWGPEREPVLPVASDEPALGAERDETASK